MARKKRQQQATEDEIILGPNLQPGVQYVFKGYNEDGVSTWRIAGEPEVTHKGIVFSVPENRLGKKIKHELDKGARRSGGAKPQPRGRPLTSPEPGFTRPYRSPVLVRRD